MFVKVPGNHKTRLHGSSSRLLSCKMRASRFATAWSVLLALSSCFEQRETTRNTAEGMVYPSFPLGVGGGGGWGKAVAEYVILDIFKAQSRLLAEHCRLSILGLFVAHHCLFEGCR